MYCFLFFIFPQILYSLPSFSALGLSPSLSLSVIKNPNLLLPHFLFSLSSTVFSLHPVRPQTLGAIAFALSLSPPLPWRLHGRSQSSSLTKARGDWAAREGSSGRGRSGGPPIRRRMIARRRLFGTLTAVGSRSLSILRRGSSPPAPIASSPPFSENASLRRTRHCQVLSFLSSLHIFFVRL